MSFSCTEQCPNCNGTGTTTIRHPVSGCARGQIDCSRCDGTGSITWEVK